MSSHKQFVKNKLHNFLKHRVFETDTVSLYYNDIDDIETLFSDYFNKQLHGIFYPRGLHMGPNVFIPKYLSSLYEIKNTPKFNELYNNIVTNWTNMIAYDNESDDQYQLRKIMELLSMDKQYENPYSDKQIPTLFDVANKLDEILMELRKYDKIVQISEILYKFNNVCSVESYNVWHLIKNSIFEKEKKYSQTFTENIVHTIYDILTTTPFEHFYVDNMTKFDYTFMNKVWLSYVIIIKQKIIRYIDTILQKYPYSKRVMEQNFSDYIDKNINILFNYCVHQMQKYVPQYTNIKSELSDVVFQTKYNEIMRDMHYIMDQSDTSLYMEYITSTGEKIKVIPMISIIINIPGHTTLETYLNKKYFNQSIVSCLKRFYDKSMYGYSEVLFLDNVMQCTTTVNLIDIITNEQLKQAVLYIIQELEELLFVFQDDIGTQKNIIDIYKSIKEDQTFEIRGKAFIDYLKKIVTEITTDSSPFKTYFQKKYGVSPKYSQLLIELFKSMNYTIDKLDHTTSDIVCRTHPLHYTDLEPYYNNENIMIPNTTQLKPLDAIDLSFRKSSYDCCKNIITKHNYSKNGEIGLRFVHPKYQFYMSTGMIEKQILDEIDNDQKTGKYIFRIKPHQKMTVLGIGSMTSAYRECNELYFMGFKYTFRDLNGKLTSRTSELYSNFYNKILLYCQQFKDILFCAKYSNDNILPFHVITDDTDPIRRLKKNLGSSTEPTTNVYTGIIRKEVIGVDGKKTYVYFELFNDSNSNHFYVQDFEFAYIYGGARMSSLITFLELQQMAMYNNLYCYVHTNDSNPTIYFSKYNIFNPNEIYPEDIYFPLSRSEFDTCLIYYRSVLSLSRFIKYPTSTQLPKCLDESSKKQLVSTFEKLKERVGITKSQLNIVKYDMSNPSKCYLTKHTYFQSGGISQKHNQDYLTHINIRYATNPPLGIVDNDYLIKHYGNMTAVAKKFPDKRLFDVLDKYFPYSLLIYKGRYTDPIFVRYEYKGKKYSINSPNIEGIPFVSILKYNPIDKSFPGTYELLYNDREYFKKILMDANVLQFGQSVVYLEAVNYFIMNHDFKTNLELTYINDNITPNFIDTVNACQRVINKLVVNTLPTTKIYDTKERYNVIFHGITYADTPYSTVGYWNYGGNKYRMLYFINSLYLLKKGGCFVMGFSYYKTNIQKQIFYIAKQLFDSVSLYLPHAQNPVYHDTGFLLCKDYLGYDESLLMDIMNKLTEVKDAKNCVIHCDDILIEFGNAAKRQNRCIINNDLPPTPLFDSMIDLNENEKYDKELLEYVYICNSRVNRLFQRILEDVMSDDELVSYKLIKSYKWAKKYDFDIQEDINYSLLEKNHVTNIIDTIFKPRDLLLFKLQKNDSNKMTLQECNDRIHKCIVKHELVTKNIDTRDTRIYRLARELFDPFYLKLKNMYDELGEKERHLTQAFFKMYEMMSLFKFTGKNLKELRTFHTCEFPGSFIVAINHYIHTKTNIEKLIWKGQSLFEKGNKAMFEMHEGMKKYLKTNWDFGPEHNGNMLSLKNIDYYVDYAKTCDLLTSDCGMPLDDNSDIMINLELHVLYFFMMCQVNAFVFKVIIPITDVRIIQFIGIISLFYNEVYLYKSGMSYTSNEFYLVMKDYKNSDKHSTYARMLRHSIENNMTIEDPSLENFYYVFVNAYEKIMETKTHAINMKIYVIDRFDQINSETNPVAREYIKKKLREHLDMWLKQFPISEISQKKALM